MQGIWTILEQKNSRLTKYSWSLINAVGKIDNLCGQPLNAIIFSAKHNSEIPEEIYGLPVDNVFHIIGEIGYDTWVVFATMIQEYQPQMIFASATQFAHELLDYAAGDNGLIFVKDCMGITVGDQEIVLERPVFSGKAQAKVACSRKSTVMATFKTNAFADIPVGSRPGHQPSIHRVDTVPGIGSAGIQIVKTVQPEINKVGITEAEVIIAGGRGLQSKENFGILYQLAECFKGSTTVGASRDAVNMGFATEDMLVGQTGKTVVPEIYFACGISGAIQHQAGMNGSKKVIAINKDEQAPIFKYADFGIAGDLFEIIPRLTKLIKERTI